MKYLLHSTSCHDALSSLLLVWIISRLWKALWIRLKWTPVSLILWFRAYLSVQPQFILLFKWLSSRLERTFILRDVIYYSDLKYFLFCSMWILYVLFRLSWNFCNAEDVSPTFLVDMTCEVFFFGEKIYNLQSYSKRSYTYIVWWYSKYALQFHDTVKE